MLTKHHGLGNDFLIAVDPSSEIDAADAKRWCDRRRGIGADGLILARPTNDSNVWQMVLWNADGSRAELSGNGLRCLGQALILRNDDGIGPKFFTIETDAGPRSLEIGAERDSETFGVSVDMGSAGSGPSESSRWPSLGFEVARQLGVDLGNPHLVAHVGGNTSLAELDLAAIGPAVEADYVDGLNIELIDVIDRSTVSLRVWERGAGITEACGSGACAAAWAAYEWGLVDTTVEVRMPGGNTTVDIGPSSIRLTGPATFVAVVEVESLGADS